MTREILVLGAGGFIGTHLVRPLRTEGSRIHAVDLKHPEFSTSAADRFAPLLQEWPTGRRRSKPAANRQESD
jgi:nucleoside-diphosphate-sugar epimerase